MPVFQLAERFVPETARDDPELARRARLVALVGLFGAPISVVYAVLQVELHHQTWGALALVAGAVVYALTPFLVRRYGSFLAGNLLGAAMYASVGVLSFFRGGLVATALMWNALIPIAAVQLGRRRGARIWAGLVVAQLGVLAAAVRAGKTQSPDLSALAPLIGLVAISTLLASAWDSARDRLEQEREALRERLAAQQKLEGIGELASVVAHDFNNLLTVIHGSARSMLDSVPPAGWHHSDVVAIEQAAERGAASVRRLLAFKDHDTPEHRAFDLGAAVRDSEPLLRRLLPAAIELELELAEGCGVRADRGEMEQLLINLVINARDAMPQGGSLRVFVQLEGSSQVVLGVRDTGEGIASESLERIFQPFYTTKGAGGTGLGLTSARRVAERAGGEIEVESRLGAGSCFRVVLPAAELPSAPAAETARSAPTEPPAARDPVTRPSVLRGPRILVVDDEPAILRVAKRILVQRGFSVLTASTATEALDQLDQSAASIDLLLTDVMMPELDGPALVQELRRRRSAAPVLFMSGYSDHPLVARMLADGEARYLRKPFDPEDLAAAVHDALVAPPMRTTGVA